MFRADKYAKAPTRQNVLYSDFTMDMDVSPSTGDLVVLIDEDAVRSSIRNLVLTSKYERLYQPLLGGNVGTALFENQTPQARSAFHDSVLGVIENYEKRAITPAVDMELTDPDRGEMAFTILFKTLNSAEPTSVTALIRRIR